MENPSSLELWVLGAALFAAVGAWVTAWITFIAWKRSQGLENMWQLIETWKEERLVSCRSRAAERILKDDSRRAHLFPEAIEILDIFELLSYLVIEGTLPDKDAWINFSSTAIPWWHILRPGVEKFRLDEKDDSYYEEFEKLVERLIRFDERKSHIEQLAEKRGRKFLVRLARKKRWGFLRWLAGRGPAPDEQELTEADLRRFLQREKDRVGAGS